MVHTEKKEEIEILPASWPAEAFEGCGESLKVHGLIPKHKCVLKNIPILVSEAEITEEINTLTNQSVQVRRLKYKDSRKPLKIVVIECNNQEDLDLIQKSKLKFRGCTAIFSVFQTKTVCSYKMLPLSGVLTCSKVM